MSISQKESVFQATMAIVEENKIEFTTAHALGKDIKAIVASMVTTSILNGETVFSDEAKSKYPTPEDVRGYVNGMVGNHWTKDTRLNGGTKYVAKNPGSRTGNTDPMVAELKKLKNLHPESAAQIDEAIAARLAEITPKKEVVVNVDLLPESLKFLASK